MLVVILDAGANGVVVAAAISDAIACANGAAFAAFAGVVSFLMGVLVLVPMVLVAVVFMVVLIACAGTL